MDTEQNNDTVELTDINPRKVAFTLNVIDNNGDTNEIGLEFRPFILRDEEYLQRTWSKKELEEILSEMKPKEMTMICFRQLTSDSKKKIAEIQVFDCDDDGNEFEIPNGPAKLMAMVGGLESKLVLHKSLLEAKGLSMPLLTKLAESMGKQKAQVKSASQTGLTSTM